MSDELYPEPPDALRTLRLRHLLTYIGPGIIIASVTIGSGELVLASRSGAIFGYTLLWCFLYAGVFKGIQVYTATRHFILTGEHPMVGWGRLPGPRFWFPLLIAVPAIGLMPIAFSAIPEMLGGFILRLSGVVVQDRMFGAWDEVEFRINVWTSLILCVCLTLALLSSEKILERASLIVLGTIVVCVACTVVILGPNLPELLAGLFVPAVPAFPDFVHSPEYAAEFAGRSPWLEVSVYLTAVGGGAYDYIGYIGMLRSRQWGLAGRRVASREELNVAVAADNPQSAVTVERAIQWSRASLLDTALSFFFVILVTLLFGILGTLVLNTKSVIPANNDLLNQQEVFLTVLHPELRWVYRVGVFLALIGTLYGAFEVYQQTFTESVASIFGNWITPARTIWLRRGVIAYCFLGGLLMVWVPVSVAGSIIQRLTFGSIISGATSCGLWCFAMLWLDRVRLPKPLRMSVVLQILTWLAGISMTVLGIQTIIAYFG
jgi:hypothetical protein